MVSQDPYRPRELDDVENASSNISERIKQPSQPQNIFSIDVPSTNLPLLVTDCPRKDAMTELAKSVSCASLDMSGSAAEEQDVLTKAWAILLHLYVVSNAIAFVVIDRGLDSEHSTARTSTQLVVSRWANASTSLTQGNGPQLTFGPFIPSQHGSKVNTAVNFADIYYRKDDFSYVLHWSGERAADLRLYTQRLLVPHKFASALWSTLLEVNTDIKSTNLPKLYQSSISTADQRTLRSFMPTPLFEGRLCLHQLFHESVRAVPHAPAVQGWDGSLTYAELDMLSSNVARNLMRTGLRNGQYVPFSFEKSIWMVVALLGILKAGGALVPIDPSQPRARAQEIVREMHANVIVTSASQASSFTDFVDTVLPISSDALQGLDDIGVDTDFPEVQPDDPAMIIFTSGSTGKPKGIVIEHGAVSTRFVAEGRAFGYQGARTLQFAASTWDIFMTDIFTTLTFQGCVCVMNEEDRRFNLAKFCTEYNVTLALITPSLATLLEPATFPTLRTLIFGGEALREDVVQKWSAIEGLSLSQGYGPAETGPCITGHVAGRAEAIGHALDNSICMLVDPDNHERLVPLGAVGELVVGGPGLLREYINDRGRTAAAVIENPSWSFDLDTPWRRFYKTGDLLRYSIDTLDGRLEFVGRTDDQVKYHGQRVELGEIEHHLSKLPGISSCMVTLVKKGCLKDRLVAVVQCNGHSSSHRSRKKPSIRHDANVTISDVRNFLSLRLPEYMVPNELLVVDEMPHSASMKLDRALVNKWISDMQSVASDSVAKQHPQNRRLLAHESTARAIAKEYASIVAGDDESRRKAFEELDFNLQLGGIDSIQIMSLAMFLVRRYGVQVPMAEMLSSRSTVRLIASTVDADKSHHPRLRQDRPFNVQDEVNFQLKSVASTFGQDYAGSSVGRVFFTGSTGFLGIEILRQLLTRSNCHVYTLVRGSSEGDAQDRLIQKATAARWWQDTYLPRLHVWQGDLSRAQLGLSKAQWQMLQGHASPSIDAIIHNGAKVHYHLDYDACKATNVSSTVELLKAVNSREEPLHSFVFVSGGQQLGFDDRDDVKYATRAVNGSGYSRSKAVSELIVKRFAEQQDPKARHVRVVKPGFIIGDSEQGVANQTYFIWRLVAASIEIGCYNEDDAGWIFVTDVTRVAQVVLRGVFDEDCKPVTKILDGMRLQDLWSLLKDKFDYDLQPLSRQQWLSRLRQAVAVKQEKHVMFPLMYMLETDDEPIGVQNGPSHATAGVQAAMEANITQLIDVGFLLRPILVRTPTSSEDSAMSATDAIDVQSVRRNFPALQQGIVPFNNAAGTVLHQGAFESTHKYMSSCPIELGHDDPQSIKATKLRENNFEELAAFVNASADEIAFGQSTTFLLRSLGHALRPLLNSDCEMVVSNLCHEASASAWISLAKDLNITIKWWAPPPGDDPCLSLETLKPLLTPKTRIVTCNHVSNVIGTIHPIRQVADMVHSVAGAILIVDGVAWAPHRPVDVKALDVDFYCFSWYKVFGPHIAQLYGRRGVQARMLQNISHFFLNEMPGLDWRLRLGCNTFELEAALVPIARYLKQVGWDKMIAQEAVLQDTFLAYLKRRPQVFRIFGEKSSDPEKRVSVITFQVLGKSSTDVANRICQRGRFRIVSGNCWAPRPTHDVLKLDEEGLIRVSFVHYNTVAEVREFCKELNSVLDSIKV
ncbi:putative nonribosomal peptide synthase [Xylariaceae sp. FL0662B]|nr:putative nonribosomal peptide synthase [Xylariaceae sp. FL0662B]